MRKGQEPMADMDDLRDRTKHICSKLHDYAKQSACDHDMGPDIGPVIKQSINLLQEWTLCYEGAIEDLREAERRIRELGGTTLDGQKYPAHGKLFSVEIDNYINDVLNRPAMYAAQSPVALEHTLITLMHLHDQSMSTSVGHHRIRQKALVALFGAATRIGNITPADWISRRYEDEDEAAWNWTVEYYREHVKLWREAR